ncbi:MAG: hypothetical protein MUO76_08250, partial [Anaerolineaceae bacterium]|nr:hypothetical protein [Anaerolineaceae bacterium]
QFGLWLTQYIRKIPRYGEYSVFYEHGNRQENLNVAAIKGFYGKQVRNANRLTDIDVMVSSADQKVRILIEIEEKEMSPKKLLGDVFAALFCNRFAVMVDDEQRYFDIDPETKLIVAGVVPSRGGKLEKFAKVIIPRLETFTSGSDAAQIKNMDFVFGEDVCSTIEKLKEKVSELFNEQAD